MDENELEILKEKINQFIWQNAPGWMTLADAEKAAVQLLGWMQPLHTTAAPGPPDPPRPAERKEIG
ncbi:hypothetical protein V6x_28200 [Gimesia chilikensis]|uniref:Uncharacterized protein n=1 Tax=Gimesia chilikensis TaxID=2605989 RepID=A0A517WCX6_9PLAN|nr:hypothetical protein [Gimesia chilikensis]QDU03108.1 hypothetical protein V6x_28200 [Gimesia chilikensis]